MMPTGWEIYAFHHAYKLVFLCELIGGEAATSNETSEVGWFARMRSPSRIPGSAPGSVILRISSPQLADPNTQTVFD